MARRFTVRPTGMAKASIKVGNKIISCIGNNGYVKATKNSSLFINKN